MLKTKSLNTIILIVIVFVAFFIFKPADSSKNNVLKEDTLVPKSASDVAPQSFTNLANSDNYVKNAINSNGEFSVWNQMPITFYIVPNNYEGVILSAIDSYNKTFVGYLEFKRVQSSTVANVKIKLVDKLEGTSRSERFVAGLTSNYFNPKTHDIVQSYIQLLSRTPNSNYAISNENMYAVVMHELGHSLGIFGHSQDENDLMYSFSFKNKGYFTERDKNTIKIMYCKDESTKQQAKNGYQEYKLKEAIDYANANPKKTIAWINLANVYYDLKMLKESLDAFKKALVLDSQDANIYQGMAQCYLMSEKYDRALEYFNYAKEFEKNSEIQVVLEQAIGVVYTKKNDYKSAYQYLLKSYKMSYDDKIYLDNLLIACYFLHYKKEAKSYLSEFLLRHPEYKNDQMVLDTLKWTK